MRTEEAKERYRIQSRDAKRRRKGTCKSCGAQTSYNGGPIPISDHCLACAARLTGIERRGKGKQGQAVLRMLDRYPSMRFSEIRDALGVSSQQTMVLLKRLMKYGMVERLERGWYALRSQR